MKTQFVIRHEFQVLLNLCSLIYFSVTMIDRNIHKIDAKSI